MDMGSSEGSYNSSSDEPRDIRKMMVDLFGKSDGNDSTLNLNKNASEDNVMESCSRDDPQSSYDAQHGHCSMDDAQHGHCSRDDPQSSYDAQQGPVISMRFSSMDDLYNFYKEHARLVGFSIVRRSIQNKPNTNTAKYVLYTCDKGGQARTYKASKRSFCLARVNVVFEFDGTWRVTKVIHNHSHDLDSDMSRLMVGHRSVSSSLKRSLKANDRAGLRIAKSIRAHQAQAGGPEKCGCLPKDCRNYVQSTRRLRMNASDAEFVKEFFVEMQLKDGISSMPST